MAISIAGTAREEIKMFWVKKPELENVRRYLDVNNARTPRNDKNTTTGTCEMAPT
jgi:hypothetical protein